MDGGNISAASKMNNGRGETHEFLPSLKTIVVDASLETLTSSSLVSSHDDMFRPLIDAVHTLRCINAIKKGITLPRIVVIGDKSSGKTSVIESLTGIGLPRGVSTRVPLIIRLQNHSDSHFLELHLEYKGKSVPVNESRISEEINLATEQIAGKGKGISKVPLTLVVKKNSVPDLTIVDLPGIAVRDQSKSVYKTLISGITKYIESDKSLILNVMSATTDFLTCESIKLSHKYDKTGERTLHVFTKLDKASKEMVAVVTTSVGHDCVCVRNRVKDESCEEAQNNEANLFKAHHLLSKFDKSIVGIPVLAQKLVLIQLTSISKGLHEMVRKINEDLKMCTIEQNKSQPHFTTVSGAMPAFLEIIKVSQKSLYIIIVSREYEDYLEDTQMHCNTRLGEMLNNFRKHLKKNHVYEYGNFLVDEIQLLKEYKTLCPEQVFSLLLQRKIDNIYAITDLFVSRVWDYIERVVVKVMVLNAQKYPQLVPSVKKAAKNVIAKTKECFKGNVFEFLEMKKLEVYTRDPQVISSWNKLKRINHCLFDDIRCNWKRTVLFNVQVSIRHLKAYPEKIINDAFDIKTKMVALLEMVLKMFTDFVESHLRTMLHRMMENEMETELVNELKSDDENKYKPLLKESPLMTTKRWKMKNRIDLLMNLRKVVEKAMDESSFHGY